MRLNRWHPSSKCGVQCRLSLNRRRMTCLPVSRTPRLRMIWRWGGSGHHSQGQDTPARVGLRSQRTQRVVDVTPVAHVGVGHGFLAARHVVGQGHRRIAARGGDNSVQPVDYRRVTLPPALPNHSHKPNGFGSTSGLNRKP